MVNQPPGEPHTGKAQAAADEVETAHQQAFLVAEGCDEAQGAFFSLPLNGPDLSSLIARRT